MASARFRMGRAALVTGPWTWGAYDTALQFAAGEYGKVELESTAGVDSIAVTIPSGDPAQITAGLPAVTVNQSTKTATWQMPAVASSVNVSVTINNGARDGITVPSYTSSLQAYIPTATGNVLFVVGETDEYSRAFGHAQKMNNLAVSGGMPAGASGDVLYHDGTEWQSLAVGSVGEVLTLVGGGLTPIPGWEPPSGGSTESVYVSDTSIWVDSGSTIAAAIYGAAITKVGNTWYLYGGLAGGGAVDTIYTSTDLATWTLSANTLPVAAYYWTAIQTSTHVYLIGGYTGAGIDEVYRAPIANPDQMVATHVLPSERGHARVFVCGSSVYCIGGYDSTNAVTDSIYHTTIANLDAEGAWSTSATVFPNAMGNGTFGAIGDKLVITGGYISGNQSKLVHYASVANPLVWAVSTAELSAADYGQTIVATGDTLSHLGGYALTRASVSSRQAPWAPVGLGDTTGYTLYGAAIAYNAGYVYAIGGRNSVGGAATDKVTRTAGRIAGDAEVITSTAAARRVTLPDGQQTMQSPSERCGVHHWTHYLYAPGAA